MRHRSALHARLLPLLAFIAGAAGGCTGSDPVPCSGPQCIDEPATTSGFELTGGAPVALVQGGVVQLDVTIKRSGFDGPVNAIATGLPAGVAATPLVIAAGATSGTLSLSALPNVPQGTTSITIAASDT